VCERMSRTGYPHPNDISAPRVLMPYEHLTLTRGRVSVDFDLWTLPDRGSDLGPVWNSWRKTSGLSARVVVVGFRRWSGGRTATYLPVSIPVCSNAHNLREAALTATVTSRIWHKASSQPPAQKHDRAADDADLCYRLC
jgi:hypothetical protein